MNNDKLDKLARETWTKIGGSESNTKGVEEIHSALEKAVGNLKAKEQVLFDIHDALGIKWGDDPYHAINQLKQQPRGEKWTVISQGGKADDPHDLCMDGKNCIEVGASRKIVQAIADAHNASIGAQRTHCPNCRCDKSQGSEDCICGNLGPEQGIPSPLCPVHKHEWWSKP